MRPAELAREAREERRRGDAAAGPAADVRHVGEVRAQLLLVVLPERHLPDAVPSVVGGCTQLVGELLVVGEESRRDVPQGDDARAGQRGDVDHELGLVALDISERIAQDQPALGVGVEDLDGLAGERGDDVAGLDGMAAGHVFAGGNDADHVHRRFHPGQRANGAQHAACAGHVELHLVHLACGLERNAAGIEGDAFADERQRRF